MKFKLRDYLNTLNAGKHQWYGWAKVEGDREVYAHLIVNHPEATKPTEQECIKILQSLAKQLKDSIIQYEGGGRNDLAEIEAFELKLIEKYLPEQLSEDDVRRLVQKTIVASEVKSINDMGKVMGILMKELSGSADGNMVQKIVKEELNA
mgnify:CR=1 FL=1